MICFATNRNKIGNTFGSGFSLPLYDLAFGQVVDGQIVPMESAVLFPKLKAEMSSLKKDLVAMVHGFNVTFDAAVAGAVKFSQVYPNYHVLLFSWPSEGQVLKYGDDSHHAQASGLAMARGILKAVDFLRQPSDPCGQSIHLLAHSMGNYVLQSAIQAMVSQGGSLRRIFSQAILAAADVDTDALSDPNKMEGLCDMAGQVTAYFNPTDEALRISEDTKHFSPRLGHDGPKDVGLARNVCAVNVGGTLGFNVEGFVGHGYYDSDPVVVKDIARVLQGQQPGQVEGREWEPSAGCFRLKTY